MAIPFFGHNKIVVTARLLEKQFEILTLEREKLEAELAHVASNVNYILIQMNSGKIAKNAGRKELAEYKKQAQGLINALVTINKKMQQIILKIPDFI